MSRKRPHNGNTRRGRSGGPRKRSHELTGTLVVTRPGVGYVETPEGRFDLVRHGAREAMNGDTVAVAVVSAHGREPRVVVRSVVERATTTFLGRFGFAGPLGAVTSLDARLGRDFFVVPEDPSPEHLGVGEGDIVVARITEYPTRQSAAVVTLERRVGGADEVDLPMESIVATYGLAGEFSVRALEEAEALAIDVEGALASEPGRRDLRGMLCVTVDPVDARDFDDAVSARELPDGGFELGVHIADVTAYVKPGSALDAEAAARGCSAYLADRVLSMLPERLCNDLCSLRPNEDRLAVSVIVKLDARGEVVSSRVAPSVIHSAVRLTYDQVDEVLGWDSADRPQPVVELLATLDRIRALREDVRRRRGAVDFNTVEAKVVLDDAGHPIGVNVRRRTRATGLIEEAMLVANECVAALLAEKDAPAAYRVHEQPSPEDLRQTVQPLRELGLVDAETAAGIMAGDPFAIQRVLAAARGTDAESMANALLLRAQKRATYLPHNLGHYALGAKAYCHFTSPIRRYPDVLVHRAVKALVVGKADGPDMRAQERALPQLCATASERERAADAAARASQKVKMAELYANRIGEHATGVVTGVERFGCFVMLDETCAEGLIATRELGHDWFMYDDARMTLTGESTGEVWGLGRRVEVVVDSVNAARGQIDFKLA